MCGVVAEVESALERQSVVARIGQARTPRAQQAGKLGGVRWLGTQRLAGTGQVLKG
jgi:hypothetical protein